MLPWPESTAGVLALAGAVMAALALFSGVLDHRHHNRADLDRVALLAWGRISVLLLFGAIVSFAVALHAS
ncbi:hypothetical protein [Novosphingobium sp.]|uniref:hypothetical protein n=1 Tax=Novosphingobium sp. TaxID=1874826 RepID=UPI0038B7E4AF